MEVHIVEEANRCLNCKKPMCQKGCPIHTPIPEIIQYFKENDIKTAGEKLFINNPLSLICATVCNHEVQCTGNCVLGKKGSPVHFGSIEQFISDAYLERIESPKCEKQSKSMAVIGCGPAGMTVAIILARKGYEVTIFDSRARIGGMLEYGIPDFRLSKSVLRRYKKMMTKLGIRIRPNTTIGGALDIDNLFRDGYACVFVGTGVWRPKTLGIKGESLGNVHFGIDYLANPIGHDLGENVAIIGMGNTAMDVARTALRQGARKVTLYSIEKRIAASTREVTYTRLEGADFVMGKTIEEINLKGPIFRASIFDENDKVIGYEEELEQVYADSTIIAVSQGPKNKLVLTTSGLKASEKGLLIVDENGMTTREGVFAAGDVVHGPATVVHAVEEAKKAAEAMIKYVEEH